MANYNLYNNVEPGSIKSATSSLRSKVQTTQSSLSTFKSSLTDGIWKATAKQTLFTAFDTIDGEVISDILKSLDTADQIADLVSDYKTARDNANRVKSSLSSTTDKTPQSTIDNLRSELRGYEQTMEQCESSIKGLL